jgi:DNA topoisomerase-1
MPKYLVIVESPAKEKTISKILGKDFKVKSSYGHIRDLPKSKLGIDIENSFEPTYVNMPRAKKVISDL